MTNVAQLQQPRPEVACQKCENTVFDGLVIKQVTVIRLLPHAAQGKCKRCKTWVDLPMQYKT
ncbi:MAG: hypothetical protein COB22_05875 [Cycloclasticus sp.]|nr:MAG: hypothetical protein COB22_05875 [Cycloclasticus sp.]